MDPTSPLPATAADLDLLPLRRPLVAVLPFGAAGGDDALRLLGSELAHAVREGLARSPAFGAILVSSQFLERAPEHAVELVCRQLRVGHLVTGHCHRSEQGASLYLELTETRQWHVRWAGFIRDEALALLAEESPAMASLQDTLQAALAAQPLR